VMALTLRGLPPRLYDAVAEKVGLMSVMSGFTGRTPADGEKS
jgi:hypothetical protein